MPLIFPRDMTTAQRWTLADLVLDRRQELSRDAAGGTYAKDLGGPLWRGSYRSFPLRRDAADALMADFETLRGAALPFFAHPAERPRPASSPDPAGPALAGVTVRAISAERDRMQFAGLPAGFVLSAGDFLSITTAAGVEFLRLARGITANGLGDTASVETAQTLRPSIATGQAVALVDPLVEMRLDPKSLTRDRPALGWFTVGFSCSQIVR